MLTIQECYKILGVGPQSSSQQIRQAYLKLVKQWHPDSQSRANYSSQYAQERFLQIQNAYEQLKQHQEAGPADPPPSRQSSPASSSVHTTSAHLNAEIIYANASDLGRQGRYDEAIEELSRAIRIDPNFMMAYKYRGHLRSLLGFERQAEADLNKARVLEGKPQRSYRGRGATSRRTTPESATPVEIEAMARKYATAKQRSRFIPKPNRHSKPNLSQSILITLILIVVVSLGVSILLELIAPNRSRDLRTPIPIEIPSIQS